MDSNLETRLESLRLEQWPEAPHTAPVLAMTPAQGAALVIEAGSKQPIEALLGLIELVGEVLHETRALRLDLDDLRSPTIPAEDPVSVRERLLETQVRQLNARVMELTRDMEMQRSAAEQRERELLERVRRERMRNFSD